MKQIILILTFFIFHNCSSQSKTQEFEIKNDLKDSIMFEKFNFNVFGNNNSEYKFAKNPMFNYGSNGFYEMPSGTVFLPISDEDKKYYYVIPPSPTFYSISYVYNRDGNLQIKGKIAGFSSGIKIGIWRFYTENGLVKEEVDEDKKFGLWTFDKVLELLNKDQVIDLVTGKNREFAKLKFFFNDNKKEWTVKVFKKDKDQYVEEYWEYIFDGNTGKYSREWYEEYNEETQLMIGEGVSMPQLKNSKKNKQKKITAIYRTHNGISYTQLEWEAYEEKEYEEYCKRTGKTYTPKDQRTVLENNSSKSKFEADDTDLGTPKPKKGFWDNLLG